MSRGDLFIVSSPSGAGKTTLIHRVLQDPRIGESLYFSVSHTTRSPRSRERTGVEYHFVDEAAFRAIEARGGFLEWAVVHGNLYGTSREEVEPRLESGIDVLLDIDVQGARQVRSHVPEAVKVIVFPPSREVLEKRLKARGSDAPDEVLRRLAVARKEMEEWGEFDYAIINEDLEAAVDELRSILVARRAGKGRRRERLESILRTFAP
jgi:guanylate kinase